MQTSELEQDIRREDFDIDHHVNLVLTRAELRDTIFQWMVHHPHIMVYYHSYYVISKASKQSPQDFYSYWDDICPLLNHVNSYHRNFALDILATLTQCDTQKRFDGIFESYFEHLNDEKYMTAACCIQNAARVAHHRPDMLQAITQKLLDIDNIAHYPEKQMALMKVDILEFIEENHRQIENQTGIHGFILQQIDSISPKTRKKARQLADELKLS